MFDSTERRKGAGLKTLCQVTTKSILLEFYIVNIDNLLTRPRLSHFFFHSNFSETFPISHTSNVPTAVESLIIISAAAGAAKQWWESQ